MDWLKEVARRIAMLFNRRRFRADLEEEMQLHLDLRHEQMAASGKSAEEAARAAHVRFGNTMLLRERSQSSYGWVWLESLAQDTLYGIRAMLRSPGLTTVALLSLALGIGANTAIFTFIDAVMLRSLPVEKPQQLMLMGIGRDSGIGDDLASTEVYSYPFYRQLQNQNQVFSDTAAIFSMMNYAHGSVGERAQQEPMLVQLVSGTYFPTLGVHALMGRTLSDEDDNSEGNHPVAMVSYAWWTRSLARDPSVLNKTIRLGSTVFSIIGVAPPEFFGTKVGEAPDIWIPLSMSQAVPPHWGGYTDKYYEPLYILGRVKPGVTVPQASADIDLVYRQIATQFLTAVPESPRTQRARADLLHIHVPLTPMSKGISDIRTEFSKPLKILMTIVVLVLLIACANIANLLLARSTVRARELAVRQALGAARMRIMRQLLTESLVLGLIGGGLGIAFAAIANRLLLRMISGGPETLPLNVSLNVNLLLFTLGVTLCTSLLFGTIPALRAPKLELTTALKDGRGASGSAARSPLARALVIAQVAFSLILLVGAGLFLRSLVNLNNVDTGFNRKNVLLLNIDDSSAGYKADDPRLFTLHQEIERRVGAIPGVRAAAYAEFTFSEGSWNSPVYVSGYDNNKDINVPHNIVGIDYFKAMQIPLIAGRQFTAADSAKDAPPVAIISESMARTLFPAGSPIGRRYGVDGPTSANSHEVIGVVKDVRLGDLTGSMRPMDYFPGSGGYLADLVVGYAGDRASVATAVQNVIHQVDRNLPITHVTTLDEEVAQTIADQQLVAELSAFFGLLAIFLSAIGIYGLMSYVVARRTNEIGIRMALGADRARIRLQVLREIALLAVAGILIGIPVTLLGSKLVTSMLFGLQGNDPWSLSVAVTVLLSVAILAGYLPARRASRVDPMVALRCE